MTFSETAGTDLLITASGEDAQQIPRDKSNLVFQAMGHVFDRVGGEPAGLHIQQENEIPIASGLGSSSSAVLAGMFGANELTGGLLSREEILQLATDLEGHPDNVAPAVYGGLVLGVQGPEGLLTERIKIPALKVLVALPEIALLTDHAREVLPQTVPLADAIFNSSRVGLLIRSLESADYDRLSDAMQDRLHQPYRIPLITGMAEAMQAALDSGAAGVALSGAGPSLIAFADEGHDAIGTAVSTAFSHEGIGSRLWCLSVENRGVTIHK